MKRKAKSEVFKQALNSGDSLSDRSLIDEAYATISIDAALVESIQVTPQACIAALADRAYKNELVTQLFPFRVRIELSSIVRGDGRKSLTQLLDISSKEQASYDNYTRSEVMALAIDLRELYYRGNSMSITKHTEPDYGTCLARQPYDANMYYDKAP